MTPRVLVRVITFGAAAILLLPPAFSQTSGGQTAPPASGSGSSTGTGAGTSTGTGTAGRGNVPTSPVPNTTTPQNQQPAYTAPIFLTGRVMLEDGTAPTEPVTIERVCNGNAHAEGYTDSRGYFGIELGNDRGVFQDASEAYSGGSMIPGMNQPSGNSSTFGSGSGAAAADRRFMNCELRARLAGYRSQIVPLANRRAMDDPNVGTILMHREGVEEGGTVSATSLAAPKDARKAFEKGVQFNKKNKPEDALKEFEKAVQIYPKHAAAWYELGRMQELKGDVVEARKSFDKAIEADPKFVNPYLQLSVIAMQERNWKEVANWTDRAIKIDSFDYPQAFLFNAVAKYNLKDYDGAQASIQRAEKLDTRQQFPQIPHLAGLILIQHHDYANAATYLKSYLKLAPNAEDAPSVRNQLTQMEQVAARKDQN